MHDLASLHADHDLAKSVMALHLSLGDAVAFCGSGVSKDLGVPTWDPLCKVILEDLDMDVTMPCTSDREKYAVVKAAIKKVGHATFWKFLQDLLYSKTPPSWVYDRNVVIKSLAFLTMSGRAGRISRVITYNFDCLLEEYLEAHGFSVASVELLPANTGGADVEIFHAHGRIPRTGSFASDAIIFDESKMLSRINEYKRSDSQWTSVVEALLRTNVIFALGVSGTDILMSKALHSAARDRREIDASNYVGFWVVDKMKDLDKERIYDEFACAVVEIGDYDNLPAFLLDIRKQAIA